MRGAVADAVRDDLARPDSRYRHLVIGDRTPAEIDTLLRDPLTWTHQQDVLVPHVAADLFGLELGVVGRLGTAEAVGDPTGLRRGDAQGDPHVLVHVGDRYLPARPDNTPPGESGPPPGPRELRQFHAPAAGNAWTRPFTGQRRPGSTRPGGTRPCRRARGSTPPRWGCAPSRTTSCGARPPCRATSRTTSTP